ncbi:hypothetical protein SLNWT_7284 [Streptomyces albus]|uniref:DUF4232 domain-containing protein n=1 Tax=Streptomyces albus (strain ATCC 21838 / DSM 41398 / FERM P-419 / JCM 4703 / NBRC 107858) TaxID=1081613 RepID=A0A0B5F7W0_STRA4|nr:hypothetical protein SLNWT_7284 [Streptomyces albus]AOU81960.1 hypothetical protein SLNHY_7269 [Streptomyces albus]AYN37645.1 DUF4232 domain-containing protein [Streptomyces albus]
MRARSILAASAAVAALAATAPAAWAGGPAASGDTTCRENQLTVRATGTELPDVLHISVTNRATRACVVDQIPTVTFGDLDGAAQPVPPSESAPYRVKPGATAYASVRTTSKLDNPDARVVDSVTVAGDPSHQGRSFPAASLGAPDGVVVWEPVTTLWKSSAAAADKALSDAVNGG